jgi:tRNA ligase
MASSNWPIIPHPGFDWDEEQVRITQDVRALMRLTFSSSKETEDAEELNVKLSRKDSHFQSGILVAAHAMEAPIDHTIYSWKINDSLYKKPGKKLPTGARGLFTRLVLPTPPSDQIPSPMQSLVDSFQQEQGDHVVCARGYDKFFNLGEVPRTKLPYLKQNAQGPFVVTLKENGCIIFVSALNESNVLVCSKNAIHNKHAAWGKRWLAQHLEAAGQSMEQFAEFLFHHRLTAVFEVLSGF